MSTDKDIQPLVDAIDRIGRTFERAMQTRSFFHLAGCGACGGPSFQQPCPHCSFYPMGENPSERQRAPKLTAEQFQRNIERSAPEGRGNLATWYLGSYKNTVAYRPHSSFAAKVDAMIEEGASLPGLPSPTSVFEAVTIEGKTAGRPKLGRDEVELWSAVCELNSALGREAEAISPRSYHGAHAMPVAQSVKDRGRQAMAQAVDAIHGTEDSWEPALDGMEETLRALASHGTTMGSAGRWVPVGNLNSALREIEGIRERREPAQAPTP